MKPTIGRIVTYTTTDADKSQMREVKNQQCNISDKLPAIITKVHSDNSVNLKVFCDGKLELWITSSVQGNKPMNWDWPVIEK